ncbi:MAG: hypothetical protein PGN15_10375 [Aeromicrobium erythreum]
MTSLRALAATATALVLALGVSACGSDDDDDVRPAGSTAPSATAPDGGDASASPSTAPSADADDVTDEALREKLSKAALAEVGTGTVTDVERSDDRGHAYEVEVDLGNDDDVTVELAEDASVVRVDR